MIEIDEEVDGKIVKKSYVTSAPTFEDYGLMDREIIRTQANPISAVQGDVLALKREASAKRRLLEVTKGSARRMPLEEEIVSLEEFADTLMKEASARKMRSSVTEDERRTWANSSDGVVFAFFLMLRHNHPDIQLEDARKIVRKLGEQNAIQLRQEIAGEDEEGNASGPAPTKEAQ